MKATSEQLKARWKTEEGKRTLKEVVEAAEMTEEWSSLLEGLPFVEEVENGRDLRGVDLRGAYLRGVNLNETDLAEANISHATVIAATLIGAHLVNADLSGSDLRQSRLGEVDLSRANLTRANLSGTNLGGVNLSEANLSGANLLLAYAGDADLRQANLSRAHLERANLIRAHLERANLNEAYLVEANLSYADLRHADLTAADLTRCLLVQTHLEGADISGARVFGVSAWGLALDGTRQENLVITNWGEPVVTADNISVAQFLYLLLDNRSIREVIDTITSKAVLILGRFRPERKTVLDAIRQELRRRNYTPVLFDFDVPANRDITETVSTLAHMARFVVADITDAKSIPQELKAIVPNLPSVPVQPLILKGQREYGMFEHFRRYPWVLPMHEYDDQRQLIAEIGTTVIAPAEAKVLEQRQAKR